MSAFGVVTYKELTQETKVELKTSPANGYGQMLTNPTFLENIAILQGRAQAQGVGNIAIYLNGELANNLFSIDKGADYITFRYDGSKEFLKVKFLLEVNIF